MKLGIMQPYFFPYAQQFRHIAQCDQWIVFDTVKFTRKNWTSRNRIANKDADFSYISVPIKKGASTGKISEAQIAARSWHKSMFNKLYSYNGIAPYYIETMSIVEDCVAGDFSDLVSLNFNIIKQISTNLGVSTKIRRLSEMGLQLPKTAEPGEWALYISKEVGAKIYSNAAGGRYLFDPEIYSSHGIKLEFYKPLELSYQTRKFQFVPDLSVIDSLMWIGVEGLKNFINR